jgi:hypothetical protein
MTNMYAIGTAIEANNCDRVYKKGKDPVDRLLPAELSKVSLYFKSKDTLEETLVKLESAYKIVETTAPTILAELENYVTAFIGWEKANNCYMAYNGVSQYEYRDREGVAYQKMNELTQQVQTNFKSTLPSTRVYTPNDLTYGYSGCLSVDRMIRYWTKLEVRLKENIQILKKHLKK